MITFLGGEFISLIGEWLEAEKLNARDPAPSTLLPGPSVEVVTRIESVLAEAPEQQLVANADEEVATSNPSPVVEELVGEMSSGVTVITLIDLEEEPIAVTDTDLPA